VDKENVSYYITLMFDIITLHWVVLTTQDSAGIKYSLISGIAGIRFIFFCLFCMKMLHSNQILLLIAFILCSLFSYHHVLV
jgi:hypothetical protein